jgi:hypothetical protein
MNTLRVSNNISMDTYNLEHLLWMLRPGLSWHEGVIDVSLTKMETMEKYHG